MPFRDNSDLISSASTVNVVADGGVESVYNSNVKATAFVIADGDVGDDDIFGFRAIDTIINGRKIFDGNGDGYISFGPNGELDIDRASARAAGNDQLQIVGNGGDINVLRYLGGKDGGFVYADASTRDDLLGHFTSGFSSTNAGGDSSITQSLRIDNDVTDNTFNMGATSVALLTDNALGLNFGGDTINGFGNDDLLIFTSKLFDRDGSGKVVFGKNLVLDLSGADGPTGTDPFQSPGGQFDVTGKTQVVYLGEKTVNDSTYYYYGSATSTAIPEGVHHI